MITDVLPIDVFWSLLCALSVAPVGYMLGSSCSPCCGPQGCAVADGKPRTDPATEGHWVPSGTWATGVTWTFSSSPSTTDGGTWYFYGSAATSKSGGSASLEEQKDWGNICNWYSNKTTTPSSTSSLTTVLDKRATRLPPTDAVVHVYSTVNTTTGPVTVKNAYFWNTSFVASEMTTTSAAYDSDGGTVFNGSFNNSSSTVNGGATFNGSSRNTTSATVNGGATFNGSSWNYLYSTINDGATFNDSSRNTGNATVNGGATFNDSSGNLFSAIVNGGATFNGTSRNDSSSTVNDGATFNDAACSERTVGSFANCPGVGKRVFVAHPTDLPTCSGTAPDGCANFADTCGCG